MFTDKRTDTYENITSLVRKQCYGASATTCMITIRQLQMIAEITIGYVVFAFSTAYQHAEACAEDPSDHVSLLV